VNEPISIQTAGHLGDPYLIVQTPKRVSQGKVPRRSLPRIRTSGGLSSRVAWALFGNEDGARSPEDRRKGQLLSALNIVLGVPLLLGSIELGLVEPRPGAGPLPWMLAAGAACAGCAYALSRTRHVRLATGLSIALLWLGPAAYLAAEIQRAQAVSPWAAVWLAVPILVAGAIARPSTSVIVGSAAILVPPAAAWGGTATEAAIAPSAFLACVGAITFVLACHRESVERDRMSEVLTKNAELASEGRAMKKRMEARAAELRKARDELDRVERTLSDHRGALMRSESFATITRETADVVHETRVPIAAVLGALTDARTLVEEYARASEDPDTTDRDHRALAADIGEALDLAKRAAERSAALVRSADMELHLAGNARSEARRRVEP
jgi:signal transduction histidine kinase